MVEKAQRIQHIFGAGKLIRKAHGFGFIRENAQHTGAVLFQHHGHFGHHDRVRAQHIRIVFAVLCGLRLCGGGSWEKGRKVGALQLLLCFFKQALRHTVCNQNFSVGIRDHKAVGQRVEHFLLHKIQVQQLVRLVALQ